MKASLSAVLIARDEEQDLAGALESVKDLADEIVVVVDARSSDKTEIIARKAGAKVIIRKFDDYARQKQAALALATKAWVLSLDADERLSPELREEIARALPASDGTAAFDIPFEVHFMGRRLRFGGLGSEHHIRLFRKDSGRFVGGALHEGVEIEGRVQRLRGLIRHQPYRDLADYVAKMEVYTALAASKRRERDLRFHWWHHLVLPWEFFARAVLKLGFLDGQPGLVWAGLSAFHSWLKYVKLRELGERPR